MTADPFPQKTHDFLTWFKSQPGTTFHSDIEIQDLRHKGAGRGIIATADIPADTVLFTIPRDTILSKETSPLTALLPHIFNLTATAKHDGDDDHSMNGTLEEEEKDEDDDDDDDETAQDSWTTLILILIHAHLQGPSSRWAPYLSILPQGPDDFNTPMFWTPGQVADLQASPVVSKIGRAEAESMIRTKILPVIRAHPNIFFPPTTTTTSLTDDALLALAFRMGSVIMAYAFDLEPDASSPPSSPGANSDGWEEDRAPAASTLGMVPLADLLNADAAFNAHISHEPAALAATTLRAIPKGAEILNYYGPLPRGELLRRYGYTTPAHARWDLVDLDWALHVLPALKAELLSSSNLSAAEWDRALAALTADDDVDLEDSFILERPASDPDGEGRVVPVTALAEVPEELAAQLKEVLKIVKSIRADVVPNKTARDRILYGVVGRAVDARAAEYATTLEEDQALLSSLEGQGGEAETRRRMAVEVRMGEKEVLREVAQSVKQRLAVLSLAERDVDGRSAKRRRVA